MQAVVDNFEGFIIVINNIVVLICQLLAIIVLLVGISKALFIFCKDALGGENAAESIQESRMELGHSFSLGLGFLIGASILKSTLAPGWNEIGHLASIIAIRTLLNYFLLRDISSNLQRIKPKAEEEQSKATS